MVKHTQTICRQQPTNYLSLFEHFVGLVLKELINMAISSNERSRELKNIFIVFPNQDGFFGR